jgi:hypothetical protein
MKVTFVDPVNRITHQCELFPKFIKNNYPMIEYNTFTEAFIVRVGKISGRPVIALTGHDNDIYYATITYTDKPP